MTNVLRRAIPLLLTIFLLGAPAILNAQTAASQGWTRSATFQLKESYDDNVLLQDVGDQARRKSWVTTFSPGLAAAYQAGSAFKAAFSYSADVARFHGEPSENHALQRFGADFRGTSGATSWEWLNSASWIEGSRYGPTYTGGGTIPAVGAVPVRNRRDALIWLNGIKLTRTLGRAFIRPLFNSYMHDFRTWQLTTAGYENYIDRQEYSGGFDAGWETLPKTRLFAGYRLGRQEQSRLINTWSPYGNTYHRALLGVEGSPADWIKLDIVGGPDFRTFSPGTASGFERRKTLYYYKASVELRPSAQDTVTLASQRYAQPSFASISAYEDVTHDFKYVRKLGDRLTARAGFKIYAGLWLQPVQRRDYIYTASAALGVKLCKDLAVDVSYDRDWASSAVANTANREFKRHLVSAGIKYSL